MILLYILIIAILVFINPILGAVGVFICLGIHILKSVLSNNGEKEMRNRKKRSDDVEFEEINFELDDMDSKKK